MSPGHDEAPGRHQGQSSSNSDRINGTKQIGRSRAASPVYVYAEVREVAGRHRDRLEMFVRCPHCGRTHAHRAPVLFLSGQRTSPCGIRYVVVAGLALQGVA